MTMRSLLNREGITFDGSSEFISLRNSLANHVIGFRTSLREAHTRSEKPDSGNGFSRGCHRPFSDVDAGVVLEVFSFLLGKSDEAKKEVGKLSLLIPAWVSADDEEARTVEGTIVKSKITHTDFPFKPWHTYYDWNFFIKVDTQYKYLVSESARIHHTKNIFPSVKEPIDIMECEWDTGFLPGVEDQKMGGLYSSGLKLEIEYGWWGGGSMIAVILMTTLPGIVPKFIHPRPWHFSARRL